MATSFKTLKDKMSPERRARVEARTEQLLAEMPLYELRQAAKMSQVRLAELLEINQASVSKMEHQTDMFVSTLRSYVEALGGDLQIIAKMPNGDVPISTFEGITGHGGPSKDSRVDERPRRRAATKQA